MCVCVYLYMCVFVLKDLLRIHDFMEAGMKLDYGFSKKCHGAHVWRKSLLKDIFKIGDCVDGNKFLETNQTISSTRQVLIIFWATT